MPSSPSFSDEATWYKSLATMYGSAAALITSDSGDVLLVKPNYRDHWSLPGGIIEDGEPPHVACAREVQEELGLSVLVGPLVAVDWLAPEGSRPRPVVAFLFDGGVLTDPSAIVLQESELDEWRFIPPGDVAAFLPPSTALRVTAGLRASASGTEYRAAYVPAITPAPRGSRNSLDRLGGLASMPAPPGVARWQDAEPPVRPSPREQATQEAVKRQPRTGSRRTRRGPPHRKARLPDERADSRLLI